MFRTLAFASGFHVDLNKQHHYAVVYTYMVCKALRLCLATTTVKPSKTCWSSSEITTAAVAPIRCSVLLFRKGSWVFAVAGNSTCTKLESCLRDSASFRGYSKPWLGVVWASAYVKNTQKHGVVFGLGFHVKREPHEGCL